MCIRDRLKGEKDALGFENYKFQQTINGIPVEYGVVNILVKNNKIISQNGDWFKGTVSSKLEKRAGISESSALSSALAFVGATSYKWQDAGEEEFIKRESGDAKATFFPKARLVYYSDPSDTCLLYTSRCV